MIFLKKNSFYVLWKNNFIFGPICHPDMWRLGDHLTFWAFNEPIFWTDATLLEIKHNTNSVLYKTVFDFNIYFEGSFMNEPFYTRRTCNCFSSGLIE